MPNPIIWGGWIGKYISLKKPQRKNVKIFLKTWQANPRKEREGDSTHSETPASG